MQRSLKVSLVGFLILVSLAILCEYYQIRLYLITQPILQDVCCGSDISRGDELPAEQQDGASELDELNESTFSDDGELSSLYGSEAEDDTDFVVVNRSSDYLRDSAILFYKKNDLDHCVERLNEAWESYNDWHLKQKKQHVSQSKKNSLRPKSRSKSKRSIRTILTKGSSDSARFFWPIDPAHFWLSSFFGPRKHRDGSIGFHHAIDMAAVKGTRVHAAGRGRVVEARYTAGWGNTVLIDHLDGRYKTRYAHLDKIHVYTGQQVTKETWIGNVGETGSVRKRGRDASHLHFEVYDRGKRVNPLPLLM